MKNEIIKICKDLEKKENIKILFAIESGSRVWRMESSDSDYDVRLVYVRPMKEYLKISQHRDVIELGFDKDFKPHKIEGSLIDINGFDIFKYLKLIKSSNPSCIEWLMSDILYYGKQSKKLIEEVKKNFNPINLYFHYKSLCKNNYNKYIKKNNNVTYKKYLCCFRGLVNARWVLNYNSIPPIIFIDAIKKMKSIIPDNIIEKLNYAIESKSVGIEKGKISNIKIFDDFIEKFLNDEPKMPTEINNISEKVLNTEIENNLF